jgi:hypothetical protein
MTRYADNQRSIAELICSDRFGGLHGPPVAAVRPFSGAARV